MIVLHFEKHLRMNDMQHASEQKTLTTWVLSYFSGTLHCPTYARSGCLDGQYSDHLVGQHMPGHLILWIELNIAKSYRARQFLSVTDKHVISYLMSISIYTKGKNSQY